MAILPGITETATGYTFNQVYTGPTGQDWTGAQSAGDFSGTAATRLFEDDLTMGTNDSRLMGLVMRPSAQYSTGYVKGAPLAINDDDTTVSSTPDATGQTSAAAFRLSHGGVSGSNVATLPAGSKIVVRGEIEFTFMQAGNPSTPVPGAPTIKAYVLGAVRPNGTIDNFGFATDRSIEDLMTQYGVTQPALRIDATRPPTDVVICFTADTLIDTDRGQIRAGDLAVGDMVRTRDAGLQPIRWIGKRQVALLPFDKTAPRPVRIAAGALGDNLPAQDLTVSPQHRMLVRSKIAQRMFGTPEVLVAAKQLCQLDGIDIADDLHEVTYVHFLFDDHQIVFANGAESESLHTGEQALKTVGPAALEEIFAIFPELADKTAERPGARQMPSGRQARKLAVRHVQNDLPLVS